MPLEPSSLEPSSLESSLEVGPDSQSSPQSSPRGWFFGEVVLIFLLFFIYAGGPPPEINEAHYLTKAKHYWNPDWAEGDTFLESSDAHLVFYWTVGWLTTFLPLPAVAWIGRVVNWLLLALAWRHLSWSVLARPFYAVVSAALMLVLVHFGQMAGEWIVGGVEAKGFAYVLLFWGLAELIRNRWNRVWLLFGAAAAFHVLVGGWAVLLAMGVWLTVWLTSGRVCGFVRMLPGLAGGFLLSLAGLLPALALTRGETLEAVREANYLYVYVRLPHHLVFHRFAHLAMARHAALLCAWLVTIGLAYVLHRRWTPTQATAARQPEPSELARPVEPTSPIDSAAVGLPGMGRLQTFVAGAVVLALIGILLDQLLLLYPRLAAPWLRYYWFRMSDAMLPVAVSLNVVYLTALFRRPAPVATARFMVAGQLVLILAVAVAYRQRAADPRPAADQIGTTAEASELEKLASYQDWLRVTRWIREQTDADARFITPWYQRTFKWYAGRSEVVTWKDVPQDARAILDWFNRIETLYPPSVRRHGLAVHGADHLHQLARQYDADYVVLDRRWSHRGIAGRSFRRVYPTVPEENPTYEVYSYERPGT